MMARMIASAMLAQDDGLGGSGMIFMLGAMFLIMYLLVFRPQRKQEKKRKAMIAAVKKNDRVLTSGGILGTVTNAKDNDVTVRIDDANNVRVRIHRNYITSVLGKDDDEQRGPEA